MELAPFVIIHQMEPIPANTAYFYQLSLLDNFSEFHPDWFSQLSSTEHDDLVAYYAWGIDVESVLLWRDEHLRDDSALAERAQAALAQVLNLYGISLEKSS